MESTPPPWESGISDPMGDRVNRAGAKYKEAYYWYMRRIINDTRSIPNNMVNSYLEAQGEPPGP